MAITIDGKSYDETKLDDKCKNSIVQVNSLQTRLKQLSVEFDNVKVLIKHHSEYLTANLPASAIVETPTAALPNSMTQNNLYVGSATDLQKMLIQKAKDKETVIESDTNKE